MSDDELPLAKRRRLVPLDREEAHMPWPLHDIGTMGPGPGLLARVLWLYCMRLASSGVGGVQRVLLALLYVGSCVGVLWMFWMRLGSGSGHGDPAHVHRAVFIFFICETSDARAAASDQKIRKKFPNI